MIFNKEDIKYGPDTPKGFAGWAYGGNVISWLKQGQEHLVLLNSYVYNEDYTYFGNIVDKK